MSSGTEVEAGGVLAVEPLRILHATGRFVVVDKPSGLLSVPGRTPEKADCVRSRVHAMYPDATGPMTVHRLDMETSGIIVVALDADAQRDLSIQFEKRRVTKRYTALVQGDLKDDEGVVELPLAKDWPNRPKQKVCWLTGKPSETKWWVDSRFGDRTRVIMSPVTGRSHQLRVHATHEDGLDAPIVGDPLYGDPSLAPRLLLHASYLKLRDPSTGKRVEVESEAPF